MYIKICGLTYFNVTIPLPDLYTLSFISLSLPTHTHTPSSVNSFVELVQYIFSLPDVSLFLSNRLCQDPLEKFFGQQRHRGRVNENPNVVDFLRNTQALRVINTTCGNIRGNCRGSQEAGQAPELENTPLPKRRSKYIMAMHRHSN